MNSRKVGGLERTPDKRTAQRPGRGEAGTPAGALEAPNHPGVDQAVDNLVEWVQTVRFDMRIDAAGLDAALRGLLDDLLLEDELDDAEGTNG